MGVPGTQEPPLIDKDEINSQFGPGMRPECKIPFSSLIAEKLREV